MSRVAVLKIGVGDFKKGFDVSLQFWSDNAPPTEDICGRLPENFKVRAFYELWHSAYLTLKPLVPNLMRSKNDNSVSEIGQTTNRASSEGVSACRRLARSLEAEMKHWLKSGGTWQPIREALLKKLSNKRGKIRIILQINNPDPVLWKLPWHVWDLLQHDDGSDLEIALSSSEFKRAKVLNKTAIGKDNVRILGVLGDSTGINVQTDRAEVERLSSADATFLDRPQPQDFLKQLRSHIGWDIFLFSGHSEMVAESARIYINQNNSLEVLDFRNSLREAIGQGLKIAIFNSCDSMGLVRDLAQAGLYIPVVIVMREEVPDAIAQAFLKEFLTEYASGQSLQTSVRRSRDRLEDWEQVWPGVTWLPVICQNPAEVPPTWQQLGNAKKGDRLIKSNWVKLRIALLASLAATSFVIGLREIGWLEIVELKAFDTIMRLRPHEGEDPRLVLIEANTEDIKKYGFPLPDGIIAQVLKKIEAYQPLVIGLDIYRDRPIASGNSELVKQLQNDRLIVVCKVKDDKDPGVLPPPSVSNIDRQGFSDLVPDSDNVIRRHLLRLGPDVNSPCRTNDSFSLRVALDYLQERYGIEPTDTQYPKLGKVVFKPLQTDLDQPSRAGGYRTINLRDYQILLNYRSTSNLRSRISIREVLNNKFEPNYIRDRIVLIGVTDPTNSEPDIHLTPYNKMPGVVIQAQMVSQIISAVVDDRHLLSVWPQWGEFLWIWGWSLVGGVLIWSRRKLLEGSVALTVATITLSGICFILLLIQGSWIPLIPSVLALIVSGWIIRVYRALTSRQL